MNLNTGTIVKFIGEVKEHTEEKELRKLLEKEDNIVTIKQNLSMGRYTILEDKNRHWCFADSEFEKVKLKKSDLRDGDRVTLRNGNEYIKAGSRIQTKWSFLELNLFTEDLKFYGECSSSRDVIKIERPVKYKTVFNETEEEKREILDKVEKKYLTRVIKPFRTQIEYLVKKKNANSGTEKEFLTISIRHDTPMYFPYFEVNTMYKGMKLDMRYTLEELKL